ncbi:MAG: M15 family metallopeptidase [Oscillospiraceae bacterium]|nr:M15 family metallopeptidase [Oscillospiraceae bacterium]
MKKLIPLLLLLTLLSGCRQEVYKPIQTDPPVPATECFRPEFTEAPTQPPTQALTEPDEDALVPVRDYIPEIREELAYATGNNFTGQVIYEFTESYLRYGTVQKLKLVCDELAEQGLGLVIWDAFRPVAAQQKLWDICPDPVYVSHPVTGNRSHCRGNAVDVTLAELETGQLLEMPTGFDDFSALADRDYSDCSEEAAKNAALLEEIMVRYGFRPYSAEWWHFADEQDYPVDETFDPSGVG